MTWVENYDDDDDNDDDDDDDPPNSAVDFLNRFGCDLTPVFWGVTILLWFPTTWVGCSLFTPRFIYIYFFFWKILRPCLFILTYNSDKKFGLCGCVALLFLSFFVSFFFVLFCFFFVSHFVSFFVFFVAFLVFFCLFLS